MPQPNNTTLTDDLLSRLQDALAGTHGRALEWDSVKALVSLEVSDWKEDQGIARAPRNVPLIGHKIRLTSE
ncbi:hypothetical protein IP76_03940 [Rhizobium sp. AAP43]|nr:hypothetical protein IP76_03940 [Rhizobium sp. AAP43]